MNKLSLAVFVCAFALISAKSALLSAKSTLNHKEADSSEENLKDLAQQLNEKFNTTLLLDIIKLSDDVKTKCPDIEDKFLSVVEKVGDCLGDIELESDTLCTLIKKNYAKCSKPARELITSCLPEESKDLPILGEKIIVAIIDNACKSTVEEIMEIFNPCAMENDPEDIPSCHEIITTVNQFRNKLPSKSLVCSTLPKMRTCAKDILTASCKNQITRNAVNKFYDAIDFAVKDECAVLNKV